MMTARQGSLLVGALFLLSLPSLTWSDIYYYQDHRGVLHFTNVPNQKAYRLLIPEIRTRKVANYDSIIREMARKYRMEFALVKAVIHAESAFDPLAISPKGARGLMQLLPETAALHRVADIHAPRDNIEGGVRHLRMLYDRFEGNIPLVLSAYNAGIDAVEQYGGVPPFPETQEYLRRVLSYRQRYLLRELSTHGNRRAQQSH